MNNNFTIVIPYHMHKETVDLLKQQLNYYHAKSNSIFIIIAVSGDQNIKDDLKNFTGRLSNINVEILDIQENDITNVISWIKKIFDGLKLVKTPYVAINGADDVLLIEAIEKGCNILAEDKSIAAVKGHTIYFNKNNGCILVSKDIPILNKDPHNRLKEACQDKDSIFYNIRRTPEFLADYKTLFELSTRSQIVGNSFYHVEHFKALRVAALGKLHVFDEPWRIQTSHNYNHSSHTPASFIRFSAGIIDRKTYTWFQSETKNMNTLGYNYYKFLWVCHQIRGISIPLKEILYNFIYRKCNFKEFSRIFTYFILNKFYIFLKKMMPKKWISKKMEYYLHNNEFIQTNIYKELKNTFFSEKDTYLITFNQN